MSEPVAYLFWYTYGPRWYIFCPRCYRDSWTQESNKKYIYPVFEEYVQKFHLICHSGCIISGKEEDPIFVNADTTSLPSPNEIRDEIRGENQAGSSPSFRVLEPMIFNIPAEQPSRNYRNYFSYSTSTDISNIRIVPNTEEI